jgi:hypothetical protein
MVLPLSSSTWSNRQAQKEAAQSHEADGHAAAHGGRQLLVSKNMVPTDSTALLLRSERAQHIYVTFIAKRSALSAP